MLKNKSVVVLLACFLGLTLVGPVSAFDPLESRQWSLDRIGASGAWQITKGSPEVIVAVIDTGVDLNQPDLVGNLWVNPNEVSGDGLDNDLNGYVDDVNGWNFVDSSSYPSPALTAVYSKDAVNHGTFISGIISAVHDNNIGIKGITNQVKIMPLVALDAIGTGFSDNVAVAINYAVKQGASVVNLSFGGPENSPELNRAIQNAYEHGVVVVAAAGNTMTGGLNMAEQKIYPICYDSEQNISTVIGVAALSRGNKLSSFSNYGGNCIDIVAPGEGIVSLGLTSATIDSYSGTSFATAIVTGTVALMKSLNKSLTVDQVADVLRTTAVNIDNENSTRLGQFGAGLINAAAAVEKTYELYGSEAGHNFYVTQDKTFPGQVTLLNRYFEKVRTIDVFGSKAEGANIFSVDLDGDNRAEIIAGAPAGFMPLVRSLDVAGHLIASFEAFHEKFLGGVRVVAGDLNQDQSIEYVVVAQSNYQPVVRVFNSEGKLLKEFLAFDKKNKAGLSVALGNVLGDDKLEIIVGAPAGEKAEVKIFDESGKMLKKFIAFPGNFKGGVNVAVADSLIIVAPQGKGGPTVRVFNSDGVATASWSAYDQSFRGGVRLSTGDYDDDGQIEVFTAPGVGGGPHIKIFDLQGNFENEFFAFDHSENKGFQVSLR